jgi:hypothetical protein
VGVLEGGGWSNWGQGGRLLKVLRQLLGSGSRKGSGGGGKRTDLGFCFLSPILVIQQMLVLVHVGKKFISTQHLCHHNKKVLVIEIAR